MAAFSLIELMFVLGLAATLGGMVIPEMLGAVEDVRAAGAARYVSTCLQRARLEAVKGNASTALRLILVDGHYRIATYVDGNGNGVLSRDILSGTDRRIRPDERLIDQFPGVDFGTVEGLPPVDTSSVAPGSDPIRLGASDMATFTPLGTATPGSLYILGKRKTQYVVRILGETGRTRVLKFNSRSRAWVSLSDT